MKRIKDTLKFSFFCFTLADTPVVLVQLVENPPWIKRDKGDPFHKHLELFFKNHWVATVGK